jgi:phosphoribosylformylglycinamidine synthase subunit PurQ / glutaminase
MKSAVVVFPGINRERDMARALKLVSGKEPAMVWHADTALPVGTDLVVIPGGFSYGDYLRADHGRGAGLCAKWRAGARGM